MIRNGIGADELWGSFKMTSGQDSGVSGPEGKFMHSFALRHAI